MISFVPWILLGAWQIAIPVDGLNDQNAAAFRERIVEYFKTRTDDAGQPIAVTVQVRNNLATLTVDCPVAAVSMSELNRALKDSPFSLKPDTWMLQGRAAFCWRSEATLPEEKVGNLRALLKRIGDTASIDVVSTQRKCHYQNTLRIVLGPDQSVPAFKIVEILEREGHRNPDLIWEKGDRTLCGATVAPASVDAEQFLTRAVVEGLKEDGAERAFVKECIAEKRELFVLKCPICEPVRRGFIEYARPGEKPVAAAGKGIPKDIVDDLKNPDRTVQLKAVERLVERYVARHYERLKMSADDRKKMQAEMEARKKEGMKMKELGSPTFGDFCPSCNAAAKQR